MLSSEMLTQRISLVWNLPPLVYVAIGLSTVWYWMSRSPTTPDNVPPFPCKPYMMLGHMPMLRSGILEKFHEWRKSTGDIFSIRMTGGRLAVVINSLKVLRESLVTQGDLFSVRKSDFVDSNINNGHLGILTNSGPSWKEQRTVSMTILKNFGMGKNVLAEKISEEVGEYLNELAESEGQPRDVHLLTAASVANVICAILVGNRFKSDDPWFVKLLTVVNDQIKLLGLNLPLLNNFPWLQYIPGDLFKAKRLTQNGRHLRNFAKHFVGVFRKEGRGKVTNFIEDYLRVMDSRRRQPNAHTYLDEDNLEVTVINLLGTGMETTTNTLLWAMLFAILNPEDQDKVYREILEVVGSERLASIQDRPRMNYTNAFIMETQRLGNILPISPLRVCSEDTMVAGYNIPKDTVIIPNLSEVLKDKDTWGDPLVFRPSRFLDKDDNLLVPEAFIPFGIGRRYCMGESLAKTELFLYVTGIFQRFLVLPEDPDNLPSSKGTLGLTMCPQPFKAKFVDRRHHY